MPLKLRSLRVAPKAAKRSDQSKVSGPNVIKFTNNSATNRLVVTRETDFHSLDHDCLLPSAYAHAGIVNARYEDAKDHIEFGF